MDARIDRAQPDRQPLPKPDLRSMLRPMGPVAVFCASNFPLAFSVAGGDSASAWAAGCPVVVKAHHAHPGTALLVGEKVVDCLKECDWPEGLFSLLFGEGVRLDRHWFQILQSRQLDLQVQDQGAKPYLILRVVDQNPFRSLQK